VKVLVTGGAGFIGSHVVENLLDRGIEARVLDMKDPPVCPPVELIRGSLTDPEVVEQAVEGCDAVIHLAAIANVDDVLRDPAWSEAVNTRGTLNVLQASRNASVGRVVYASTIWVYSDCDEQTVDEDTRPAAPSHVYTATKLAGELYCKSYQELYGLDYTVLRFGIPYGPRARDGGVIRAFVERALAGEPLSVAGNGEQSRRFVYVADLADGCVRALQPQAANRIYNLASQESVSILQVAETVQSVLGTGEIVHVPARSGDFPGKEIATSRAELELGWTPATSFTEGVRRYAEWFRHELETRPALESDEAPSMKRVLILTADIGEGHDLPARALAEDLASECPGIEVAIEDCLVAMGRAVQFIIKDNSRVMFRMAPWLFGFQYFLLSRFAPTRWLSMWLTRMIGSRAIMRLVKTHNPDAVVSTYPGSTALIGELRRRRRLTVPTFSAITDLAGLRYWAHPGVDMHTVTHPESIEEVERIAGAGSAQWARPPTSRELLAPRSRVAARNALSLPDGRIVVVSGGGWGIGKLESAISAALALEDTTVVCLCGHNDELRERLEQRYVDDRRVRPWGFTDQMGDLLAAANALVHSTAGLTVLEAIMRGCPVVSYGFSAGHVHLNDRAYERFGLARVARSEDQLTSILRTLVNERHEPDLRFASQPSAASLVLRGRPRVRPMPVWRLRLGRSVAVVASAIVSITLVFASDDSYTLFARALDLPPMTSVSTEKRQVALIVDAPPASVPGLARSLSARHMRASFALDRSTTPQTISALAALGDDPIPKLAPGGPVRWLGTTGQLKHTARDLGLPKHFFYAIPGKGFTLGQYVLGHVEGATAVSPTASFGTDADRPSLDRGDIVELVADREADWLGAVDSLVGELRDRGLEAVPVAALVSGRAGH
jgi:nucleoside-diphosphate-sugar epimerase/UDP-N-acetylglucosamine:LPS N-acetylglucosamine transferase